MPDALLTLLVSFPNPDCIVTICACQVNMFYLFSNREHDTQGHSLFFALLLLPIFLLSSWTYSFATGESYIIVYHFLDMTDSIKKPVSLFEKWFFWSSFAARVTQVTMEALKLQDGPAQSRCSGQKVPRRENCTEPIGYSLLTAFSASPLAHPHLPTEGPQSRYISHLKDNAIGF